MLLHCSIMVAEQCFRSFLCYCVHYNLHSIERTCYNFLKMLQKRVWGHELLHTWVRLCLTAAAAAGTGGCFGYCCITPHLQRNAH
jgi:hypothetical protein